MADIESANDTACRVWSNFQRGEAAAIIEARDNAVANAVLVEYMALVNEKVMAAKSCGRLDCFRNAYADLRAKHAAKGGR